MRKDLTEEWCRQYSHYLRAARQAWKNVRRALRDPRVSDEDLKELRDIAHSAVFNACLSGQRLGNTD